jgi:GT2 family glycosyltransferase
MTPKVAAVIVNWNKKECTLNLLVSFQKLDYDNYEIFLVDNASTDDSVKAVSNAFPGVHIIANKANLGGTGGFNTGLRFALEKGDCKYVWLLDNDAQIEPAALKELVMVMEGDERIGIAGSRIVDSKERNVTIEAGSFFCWNDIEVKPFLRNERTVDTTAAIKDVDYVAICSALVRTAALKKTGLMDERYFLFWDDMDWGLEFKKHAFRVVSVLASVVYHPPFTEKRSVFIDFYYGYRNPLLTYAKHTELAERLIIYLRHLRYRCKILIFLSLNGRKDLTLLGFQGIYDFVLGKWGGRDFQNVYPRQSEKEFHLPDSVHKIIILNTGGRDDIYGALYVLKKIYPNAAYTLLMHDDRASLFSSGFDSILGFDRDKHSNLLYLLRSFLRILLGNFDLAVNPKFPSPFSYAVKRGCIYDNATGRFSSCSGNIKNIWKLLLSTLMGEITSVFLLPLVYICSLRYDR